MLAVTNKHGEEVACELSPTSLLILSGAMQRLGELAWEEKAQ